MIEKNQKQKIFKQPGLKIFSKLMPAPGQGFTIIELIVTIFVLTLGILAAFIVIEQPIRHTANSMSRLTADYFAQSGLEYIRNQRDLYWIENKKWDDFCNNWSGPKKDVDPEYITGEEQTKFTRTISVNCAAPDPDEAKVIIEVSWKQRGVGDSIKVQENLYNWYEQE